MAVVISLFLLIFVVLSDGSAQVRVEKSDIDILNGDYQYYTLDSNTHQNVYYQTKHKIYAIPQTYDINGTLMFLYVFSTKYSIDQSIDQSIDAYVITTAGPDTSYQIDIYTYYVYNGTAFVTDDDMDFFDTSSICISDTDQYGQYIDGTYTFDHYNYTRHSTIYRNIATDIYLYGWTIPNNTYPWILGPDYNVLDPAVFCGSITTIYRYSTPITDCDTWYIWSNITLQYQIDSNVTSGYCYDLTPTVSITPAPTVEPTNGGFSTTMSRKFKINTSSTTAIPTIHNIQTTADPTTQPTNGGFSTHSPTIHSISTTAKPTLSFPTPSPSNIPTDIVTGFITTTEAPTPDPTDVTPTYYIDTTQKPTRYPSVEPTYYHRFTEVPTTEPSNSIYTSIPTASGKKSNATATSDDGLKIALIIIGIVIFIVVAGVVYKYMIAPKMNEKKGITNDGYQNMSILNEASVSTVVITQSVTPQTMVDKKPLVESGVTDEVGEFMRNNKLEKYEAGLRNIAGVENMDDLMDLAEDELKEVAVEAGINKGLYQNRFVKAVKELQLKKQRAASIATPQYIHPQYQI